MTNHSEKDPEAPEVQQRSENESKLHKSGLQKFKHFSNQTKALIMISFILYTIFLLGVGSVIGVTIKNLERNSLHAYDYLENDEHFEFISDVSNQTHQGMHIHFVLNLVLVIAL